ncbi:DNA internalization-related competence protein ComEC/Rec2 [Cernens ardua]|uniref:DNA internalization-related competence protein ComEC/Rec2 n=1 Tax=Cernens ardua TaxID=3402176 RepID=UPI003F97F283
MAVFTGTLTACLPLTHNGVALMSALAGGATLGAFVLLGWKGGVLAIIALASWCSMTHALNYQLPFGLNRQDVMMTGRIERISLKDRFASILFRVEQCRPVEQTLPDCDHLVRVKVGWANPPDLHEGEVWAFQARIQAPHSRRNPSPFPATDIFLPNAIGAVGKVRLAPTPVLQSSPRFTLHRWVGERLSARLAPASAERWVRGLVLGETTVFTPEDWRMLNDSGTVHLVVVSGMHIGFLVLGCVRLISLCWRMVRPYRWRLACWPWWPALGIGAGYVTLSGSGPAAERAWIMMLAVGWAYTHHYPMGVYAALWIALGTIVMVDPLTLFRPGLWLSFIAVLTLLVGWRWRKKRSGPWALIQTQLTLGLIMDGVVLLFFGQWMPASLIANLLAIPWVTMVMLPLALVGTLLEFIFHGVGSWPIWWGFKCAVALFEYWLTLTVSWLPAIPIPDERRIALAVGLILLGSIWLVPGFRLRYRAVLGIALLPMMAFGVKRESLSDGELILRVHDVGQGQLVDIRTATHRLLYDTGPRFYSGDTPISRLWRASQTFDKVIVSHADLDHSGGVPILMERHQIMEWMAPSIQSFTRPSASGNYHSIRKNQDAFRSSEFMPTVSMPNLASLPLPEQWKTCRAGQQWTWDNIEFRLLWPSTFIMKNVSENQRSCILLISAGQHRILIPGDADAWVEKQLLRFFDEMPSSLLLLVSGHHGSRTSSTHSFLTRIQPHHVVHSAGFLNQYGHPAQSVVRRINDFTECQWSTALDGAITLKIKGQQALISPEHVSAGIRQACLKVSSSG